MMMEGEIQCGTALLHEDGYCCMHSEASRNRACFSQALTEYGDRIFWKKAIAIYKHFNHACVSCLM